MVRDHLNAVIQEEYHSSLIDARAVMAFFKLKETLFQNCIRETKPVSTLNPKRRPRRKRGKDEIPQAHFKMNEPFVSLAHCQLDPKLQPHLE